MEMFRLTALACIALALTPAWGASPAAEGPEAPPAGAPTAEAGAAPAEVAAKPGNVHGASHVQHPAHRSQEEVLDERVAALGKSLGLDAGQKAEVRKILLVQRDQLRQVWSDPARSSADRIGASQSINQQTEDRIRSILNEEQRKQYIVSKPAGAAVERPEHGLDYWMDQMQGKH
jgi:hypothetical protein